MVMINDIEKWMGDIVHYWDIYKWQKVVSVEDERRKMAQCLSVVSIDHQQCFWKMKKQQVLKRNEREREWEEDEERKKKKKK